MRAPNPLKEVHQLGLRGEELAAFLRTLKSQNPLQFRSLERSLRMLIPTIQGVDITVNDLGEAEIQLQEKDLTISARTCSEGTLRILGILALASSQTPPTLIGFEDIENGLHPRRIELLARVILNQLETTQQLITTHSPLLLDQIPHEHLYNFTRVAGQTTVRPISEGLYKDNEINQGLDDQSDVEGFPALSISQKVMRGDYA
jgi:predicted ATPase